ncbi:MAG: carboxypeptidase regulatory-like domain-containing protein [Bryobacteraceae bacterium]
MRLALLTLLAVGAFAQEFRSTVTGRVTDQSQAVVPGAKIEAVQVETGARTETVSGQDGQYTLPFLLPGTYRIGVEAPGMKRTVREGITINANERKAIDIQVEVGAVAESVVVTADTPILDTVTGAVGQVVSQQQVENIPMNGRTPLMMAQLWAGVITNGGPNLTRPFDLGHTSDFSVGGAPSNTNELLMDGSPNTIRNGQSAYSPPMDSVQEVKVEGFQSDAAYGSTGAGTVNVVTKAGTNDYHGTVYDFNQVSRLAATPFFINRSGQRKPFMLWNQFGASSGGPVWVPKVLNGRDRLFFFFAYEGIRQPNPLGFASTVPTEAMRKGDFSSLLRIGSNYQIYDPFSGVREGTRVRRQPLPNNVVPQNRLNPVALNLLQYWPMPNAQGGADGRNNFFTNAAQRDNFDNQIGRLDFNASARHKMFFAMRHSQRNSYEQAYFANIARGRDFDRRSWGAMFDDVITLSPTTVVDTRLNWTRFYENRRLLSTGMDLVKLGFPASVAAASAMPVMPRVEVSAFAQLGESNHNTTPFDSYQVFSSVMKVAGRHTLKFGGDARLTRESDYKPRYSAGRYQFSTNWTRGPLDSASGAPLGQDFAAFLMGLPTGGSFDLNAFRTNQAAYAALFLQDDIRASSRLTLNLGLRWDKETPTTERFNRMTVGFDPTANNSIAAAARAAYARNPIPEVPVSQFNPLGGLLFASADKRSAYETGWHNFSPRFGFAWTPAALGGKTVIRGGAGVFFFDLGINGIDQTGYSQSTQFVSSQDGWVTPYSTLSNPFPDGIQQPLGSAQGFDTYLGRGVSFYNPHPSTPYSVRWNFNIQRQLGQNLVLELGYLMNHSVHLSVDRPLNFVPAQYLSTAPLRDQATIDYLSAQVPNPFAGLIPGTNLNSSVVSRQTLLNRFQAFSGVSENGTNQGSSYANMLLAKVDKRFSGGLQLQGNFQYSRIMQRLDRLNDSDPVPAKRVASEDRPMRAVVSSVYALPFGKGARGWRRQAAGGWTASGVYMYQAGAPVEWGDMIYFGGDLNWQPSNIDAVFDTSRFNTNSRLQRSMNLRTFPLTFSNLRGDSVGNFDLSVIKDFPLRERLKLQYRCEFFNAFNHPQFDIPDVSATSSTFGRISNQANLPRRIQMALKVVW